jgi:hypothetical protein
MECKLCKINEADKTGSHIFSSALISNCINQVGKKGRDKEVMFGIGQDGSTGIYFGRDIQPEKIEEIKGRPLTDDELVENNNDIILDYVFCTPCEKVFGDAETAFAKDLSNIRINGLETIKDGYITKLYFLIQIFRASSVNYDKWQLKKNFEELLRKIVFSACYNFKEKNAKDITAVNSIPLIVSYLKTDIGDESSNFVLISNETNPYALFLCDFVVQIYDTLNSKIEKANFLGLNKKESENQIEFNCDSELKLNILSNEERKIFLHKFCEENIQKQFLNSLKERFAFECKSNGITVTQLHYQFFFTELLQPKDLTSDSILLSEERITKLINRNIEKWKTI